MWHVRGNALKTNLPWHVRNRTTLQNASPHCLRAYIYINPLATLVVARGLFVFSCRYVGDDRDD